MKEKRKDRKNVLAIKFKNGEERKEGEGCARKTGMLRNNINSPGKDLQKEGFKPGKKE